MLNLNNNLLKDYHKKLTNTNDDFLRKLSDDSPLGIVNAAP